MERPDPTCTVVTPRSNWIDDSRDSSAQICIMVFLALAIGTEELIQYQTYNQTIESSVWATNARSNHKGSVNGPLLSKLLATNSHQMHPPQVALFGDAALFSYIKNKKTESGQCNEG